MWSNTEDSGVPPSGGSTPDTGSQDLQDLKEQYDQQQLLIAQLREIIKKSDQSQTTMTQEKVVEYANTLSKMKSRAKRHRADGREESAVSGVKLQTPASEKVLLMRQQMEENKIRLAERGRSQKGIEEMVTQIKAQLDDSQQQISLSQTPLNISLIEDRVDYTPQLSSQELYDILLNKDKRIGELNARICKLQANVMDLQENLKEKDSVIDARTKAITLMSENLSKKSRNTVDALEDTKEQMRQMQERFIEVEENLKQRNASLQSDLDTQCFHLANYASQNDELRSQVQYLEKQQQESSLPDEENVKQIEDLKAQLQEKHKEMELGKERHTEFEKTINILEEQYEKLRREHSQCSVSEIIPGVEEMTKLKHQLEESNKSMIKVKAQHKMKLKELNKKIDFFKNVSDVHAELLKSDNEKSRLQLKIVELEEEKGQMQLAMVNSRDTDALVATITDLKQQIEVNHLTIETHNEETAKYRKEIDSLQDKLEQFTHDEVKSELSSVQFEEQLDILEKSKQSMQFRIDELQSKVLSIESELEAHKKEKLEQLHKYEAILQENAELIDRLEKLSAEKVSSAESIEFVDNLTQQEKLELEAYQKSLSQKEGGEHDDTPDLNETVNQLTEETSELLQKIELFTVERREVMEKLDLLKHENNTLNIKLKQIENNRDVLIETYEELQTEKEVLHDKLAQYETEMNDLQRKFAEDNISQMREDIEEYKKLVSIQKEEISEYKLKLLACEGQHDWEEKYRELSKDNDELRAQVENYNSIIEENKQDIIKYAQLMDEHSSLKHESNIMRENLQSQEDLVEQSEKEIAEQNAVVKELEVKLKEMDQEIQYLREEKTRKQRENEILLEKVQQDSNILIESKIKDFENKNKEQLEKMKRIAANLKKKSADYKVLEQKYNELQNNTEINDELRILQGELKEIKGNYKRKQEECADLDSQLQRCLEENATIKSRNEDITNQLHTYSAQIEDLQNMTAENESQLSDLRMEIDHLHTVQNEREEQNTTIRHLQLEIDTITHNSQSSNNTLRAKIHEQEMHIQNLVTDLHKYKDQVGTLEEGIANIQEMRQSLECRAIDLEHELQAKEASVLQAMENEEMLERRLDALIAKGTCIERQMEEVQEENKQLQNESKQLTQEVDNYKRQLTVYNEKLKEFENMQELLSAIEIEKQEFELKTKNLENEIKKLNIDLQSLQDQSDRSENEQQEQLESYVKERKQLHEHLEIARDQITQFAENDSQLQNIVQSLNAKLDQQQVEFDETISRFLELQQEHKKLLANVEDQEAKVIEDYKKQQNSDQSALHVLLQSKKQELEQFRCSHVPSPADFFGGNQTETTLVGEIEEIETKLRASDIHVDCILKYDELKQQFEELSIKEAQLQVELSMIQKKVEETDDTIIKDTLNNVQAMSQSDVGPSSANMNEELLLKIKTLEFMLYNVEQDKESALVQCAQLSDELGRLIYEKEQPKPLDVPSIDRQIISDEEAVLPFQLPCDTTNSLSLLNVHDEGQDDLCIQKTAYQCQPSTFGDCDGWAIDPEETKLEETHIQASESRKKVVYLEEQLRLLKIEKEAQLQELQQANVKSGKLIKKLKEFKAKNEQLAAKLKASDECGLDDAILEELKLQVAALEKRIKEVNAELECERKERVNCSQRCDVLTSANELLIDMKEQLNVDVMRYQQQTRDLEAKLEQVAWGMDSSEAATTASNVSLSLQSSSIDMIDAKAQELIKDLTLDNEELQTMLEEQTKLRREAEILAKRPETDDAHNAKIRQLVQEKELYQSQIQKLEAEREVLTQEMNALKVQAMNKEMEYLSLEEKLQENYKDKTMMEATALENSLEIDALKKQVQEISNNIAHANTIEVNNLKTQLLANHEEILSLNLYVESLTNERHRLERENSELESHKKEVDATLDACKKIEETQLDEINQLRQRLSEQERNIDAKLSTIAEQLAAEWSQHVEQRGNDVAESWKLHVETRENEFMQLEKRLRSELHELEEKCNIFVNENNELRRNVDAEIRNEVDRIAALQQQITDGQTHASKLSEILLIKDKQVDQLHEENVSLKKQLNEYEIRINTHSEELSRLMQQQDEKDEKFAALSAQLQDAIDKDNKASEEIINVLRGQLSEKDNEITQCKNTIDDLAATLEQYNQVKQQLEDNHEELLRLKDERSQYTPLKKQLSEASLRITTLQGALQEKEHRLVEFQEYIQQVQNDGANSTSSLQNTIQELQQQIATYCMQLQENQVHIATLSEEVENGKALGSHLQSKEMDIQRLNGLLEEKQREHDYVLENQLLESQSVLSSQREELDSLRRMLNQVQLARDELVATKDAELEVFKEQLQQVNKLLEQSRLEYVQICAQVTEYESRVSKLPQYEHQVKELKAALENQAMSIEHLQHEVLVKSQNYDALVAELNTTHELKSASAVEMEHQGGLRNSISDNPADAVSRAELDIALYMLHQRDVRCEELTVELMQLLEERDTLQLRLSNALREKEQIRSQFEEESLPGPSGVSSGGGANTIDSTTPETSSSSTEMAAETIEKSQEAGGLENKLSELKIVGYKKDKTLVDEKESRRLQQLAFIEQHKDEVAKLPPEAQARLLDASYTLSRDVQSPSKVLLNWLWGKSTPRVNNI